MKLGRVIGRVVCTRKMECFDVARAGEGDLVIFEAGKEAAQANPNGWFNPADAAILGVVDELNTAD